MEKLGNESKGNGKMRHRKKGNIYITAEKTAAGNLDNGKLGNGK